MNRIITKDLNSINHEVIMQAKQEVDLIHIPSLIPSNTGWDEFIAHSDFTTKNKEKTLDSPVKIINALQVWDDFFVAGYYVNEGNFFHQLQDIFEKTASLYGRMPNGGCTLINFIGNQKTIPIHTDIRDSFLWQAIGTVEWRIYDKDDHTLPYQSLWVKPGDVLFVPSGIAHTVYCPDPRAAISIFYDKEQ
jgi:hypothetical protein